MANLRQAIFRKMVNFWPPFLGAGIHVSASDPDFRTIEVRLKLKFWNRNYVGTQFGGSLYSMCDPFFMLILMQNLGSGYIVWDKAATIRFKKPGKGPVKARFHIPLEKIEEIRKALETQEKIEPKFKTEVIAEDGVVVAEVEKLLYVRKK